MKRRLKNRRETCDKRNAKGDPLKTKKFEKFLSIFETKRKMRILNSLIVPKYIKRETRWDFWHFSLLQNITKLEVGTL